MSQDITHLYNRVRKHLLASAKVKSEVAGMARVARSSGQSVGGIAIKSAPALANVSAASALRHQSYGASATGATAAAPAVHSIVAAAQVICDAFRTGGKLLLCGNGGSAADCQHMATEFMNLLHKDFVRAPLPAIALTTDSSFLTAFGNDFKDFSGVFARQVRALGKAGDVLLAISTSGTSPNVLDAIAAARDLNLRTIALTGRGGRLAGMADIAIAVPSSHVHHIQEAHLAIEHIICELVEQLLFDPQGRGESEVV